MLMRVERRISEKILTTIEENQKEREKAESEGTQHDADGSSTEDKRTE